MQSDVILFFFSSAYMAYCTRNDCALNTKNDFHQSINQIAYTLATDRHIDRQRRSVCLPLSIHCIYLFRIFDNTLIRMAKCSMLKKVHDAEKNTLLSLNYHQFDKF